MENNRSVQDYRDQLNNIFNADFYASDEMMQLTNETWVQCTVTLTHICESCQLQYIINV